MSVTLNCQTCGKDFTVKDSRVDTAKYCSKECFYASRRKQIERICEYCGKKFYVPPSRVKYGRGKHCSPECQYAHMRQRAKDSNAREWHTCLNCGEEFWVYKYRKEGHNGLGKYCCRECRDAHWMGANHPQFIHGNGVNWHGPNWYSQRRAAQKRDGHVCQNCGMTHEENQEVYGGSLDVHHIRPFRLFDDYEEANNLENLVTLCRACHRKAEAEIQAEDS